MTKNSANVYLFLSMRMMGFKCAMLLQPPHARRGAVFGMNARNEMVTVQCSAQYYITSKRRQLGLGLHKY